MTKKAYISINKQQMRKGEPAIRVAVGKSGKPWFASEVVISGPSRLIQADKPYSWGARVVLEVDNEKDISTWQ